MFRPNTTAQGRRLAVIVVLLLLLLAAACTATRRIDAARDALESARGVHADYLSPYEFASAEIFLNEAKDQAAHSNLDRASRYAEKALDFAEAARRNAEASPARTAEIPPKAAAGKSPASQAANPAPEDR